MSDLRPNWRKTLTLRPEPAVIFIETGEQKEELTMAARVIKEAAENPSTSLKVKVVAPYRVVFEGKPMWVAT